MMLLFQHFISISKEKDEFAESGYTSENERLQKTTEELHLKEVGYNFVLFFLGPMLQFMWDLVKHFSTELKMGLTHGCV